MTKKKSTNKSQQKNNPEKASPVILSKQGPKTRSLAYGIIILLSFLLYGNTIHNKYALDDTIVLTGNKYVLKGFDGIKEIFSYDTFKGYSDNIIHAVSGGRYRPFSVATFAVEYQCFGSDPGISHFINILFYALTCLMVFIVLARLLKNIPGQKWFLSVPFIAAVLFAAHPVHTEVVANIKSRDEIFALLFSLIAMWLMLEYLDKKKRVYLIFSPVIFFLALLSKESALTFIVIMPLALYFFTDHKLKKILLSSAPWIAAVILFVIIRQSVIGRTAVDTVFAKDIMNDSFAAMTISQKYATITYTFGYYLKLIFFPHPLTYDYYPYHIPVMTWSSFSVIVSLIIYVSLVVIAFAGMKKKRFISFCIFLFLIPLAPTSNILFPVGTFMSERFLYASSLGFALFIAYLAVSKPNKFFRMIFIKPLLIIIPVVFLYSFKTIDRNKDWKDNLTLFAADVITSSNSAKSTSDYGNELYNKGEACKDTSEKMKYYDLAAQYLERSFSINPNIHKTNLLLGTIYGRYKNDMTKSIYFLNNAINLDPSNVESYNNLGTAYGITKQYDKAIGIFEKGLSLSPDNKELLGNLVLTYQMTGKTEKAAACTARLNSLKNEQK